MRQRESPTRNAQPILHRPGHFRLHRCSLLRFARWAVLAAAALIATVVLLTGTWAHSLHPEPVSDLSVQLRHMQRQVDELKRSARVKAAAVPGTETGQDEVPVEPAEDFNVNEGLQRRVPMGAYDGDDDDVDYIEPLSFAGDTHSAAHDGDEFELRAFFSAQELDRRPLVRELWGILRHGTLNGSQSSTASASEPVETLLGANKAWLSAIREDLPRKANLTLLDVHGKEGYGDGMGGELGLALAVKRPSLTVVNLGVGVLSRMQASLLAGLRQQYRAENLLTAQHHIDAGFFNELARYQREQAAKAASLGIGFAESLEASTLVAYGFDSIFADVIVLSGIEALVKEHGALLPHELEHLIAAVLDVTTVLYLPLPLPRIHFFSYWKSPKDLLRGAMKRATHPSSSTRSGRLQWKWKLSELSATSSSSSASYSGGSYSSFSNTARSQTKSVLRLARVPNDVDNGSRDTTAR